MMNSIQLFNIQLDISKTLVVSLTQIFGINFFSANIICKKFGFSKNSLLGDVSLEILNNIRKFILSKYIVQEQLRNNIQYSIQQHVLCKSVKGLRHKLKLPVRGQRTRTNHKTQKRHK